MGEAVKEIESILELTGSMNKYTEEELTSTRYNSSQS